MPRILIADDEVDIRFLYSRWLAAGGHEPVEAIDGPSAIEAVVSTSLDLILLDVMMPGMDGFDACRLLRTCGCAVPIVLISALTNSADIERSAAVGATSYVDKIASREELLALVGRTISTPTNPPRGVLRTRTRS